MCQSYILYSWKTSWCFCRSRTSVLFSGVTVRTSQERLTRNIYSVPSSSSALCWCARWRQVSVCILILQTCIFEELILIGFLYFPKQITDHFLWSPCPKMELRSMSWWPKQCPSRKCKLWPLLSFWGFWKPWLSFIEMSFFSVFYIRWQEQIAQRAEVMNAKPHSVIPLPQHEWVPHYFLLISA